VSGARPPRAGDLLRFASQAPDAERSGGNLEGQVMDYSNVIESFLNGRVTVLVGDISQQQVDALVNAANSTLMGGGGVDGAIHYAGGPKILKECKEIRGSGFQNGFPAGEAVITTGGNLAARYVIHTVGPIKGRSGGRDAELLAACYRNSLA